MSKTGVFIVVVYKLSQSLFKHTFSPYYCLILYLYKKHTMADLLHHHSSFMDHNMYNHHSSFIDPTMYDPNYNHTMDSHHPIFYSVDDHHNQNLNHSTNTIGEHKVSLPEDQKTSIDYNEFYTNYHHNHPNSDGLIISPHSTDTYTSSLVSNHNVRPMMLTSSTFGGNYNCGVDIQGHHNNNGTSGTVGIGCSNGHTSVSGDVTRSNGQNSYGASIHIGL